MSLVSESTLLYASGAHKLTPTTFPARRRAPFAYNRAMKFTGLTAVLLAGVAGAGLLYAQGGSVAGEWQTYSGDAQGRRYSPLSEINTTNISTLKLAWQYGVASTGPGSTGRAAPSQ